MTEQTMLYLVFDNDARLKGIFDDREAAELRVDDGYAPYYDIVEIPLNVWDDFDIPVFIP